MMSHLHAIKKSTVPYSKPKPVKKVFIAGVGAVGCTLIQQLESQHSLKVVGICNSRHVQWFENGEASYRRTELQKAPEKDWNQIVQKLTGYKRGSVIFIDATGSSEVTELYPLLFEKSIHIVTPSKLANTQSQDEFDKLHRLAADHDVEFHYETNVGAGLPVVNTVKSLITSGDEIIEISGVVSGTMTYLFSELESGAPFSETVNKARTLGYAEPDPRDDLSGEDVVRKFMILARICGVRIERDEVSVESLIPEKLRDVDPTQFLEGLKEFDHEWQKRIHNEEKQDRVLRYTGKLADGKISIGIESVPKLSPLGSLSGTTNLITIRTRRYSDQPLTIQGPGAGKEVTAAGVLADILKIV
jgi:bifunctional aspartokinase / homoserine dehydrogenase 1